MKLKKNLIIFFILVFPSIINAEEIFLSLKKSKVNVRYGPSIESPIKFVYRKINILSDETERVYAKPILNHHLTPFLI